eukprot:6365200-Prymnesium_polylepis.3
MAPLAPSNAPQGRVVHVASRFARPPSSSGTGMPSVRSQLETQKLLAAKAQEAEAAATSRVQGLATDRRCLRGELSLADEDIERVTAHAASLYAELSRERAAREEAESALAGERRVSDTLASELEASQHQSALLEQQLGTMHASLQQMRDHALPRQIRATEEQRVRAERAEEGGRRRALAAAPETRPHVCVDTTHHEWRAMRQHSELISSASARPTIAGSTSSSEGCATWCGRASSALSASAPHSRQTRTRASRRSHRARSAPSAYCTPSAGCTRTRTSSRCRMR